VGDAVDSVTRIDKTIVVEGFGFAGVIARVPPFRSGAIQIPKNTPPGMKENWRLS